jgi:hypothetical protein
VLKFILELFIDPLKMILKISSGSLYKISIIFEPLGCKGGLAANQGKEKC